jgi:hypothetical protein
VSRTMVGQSIPLSCQVDDGNQALSFEAVIKDFEGVLIGAVKLGHHGRGLYTSRGPLMPDVPFVVVQYFPSDVENYSIEAERIDSIPRPSEPIKYIAGHVTKRLKSDLFIGKVKSREKIKAKT